MRTAWLGLAGVLLLVLPASATTMLTLDVEELTRFSNSVVVAEVQGVDVLDDQPGVPLYQVTVSVQESLKGDLDGTVLVSSPGFPGAPVITPGEQLVLFIHSEDGVNVLTGFQQGHFRVEANGELHRPIPVRGRAATSNTLDDLAAAVRAAAK